MEKLRDHEKRKKIIPIIMDEVKSQKPKADTPETVVPSPVKTAHRRESDIKNLDQNISEYLDNLVLLRDRYANRLYALLLFEVIVMFVIVFLAGFEILKLEQWLVLIVAESIIAKTFLTIHMIVKNLFPNRNLLEMLVQSRR